MMKLSGRFTTPVGRSELRARHDQVEQLAAVDTLADVRVAPDGTVRARFTPRLPLGRIPFDTRIRTTHTDDSSSVVTVHASRGAHRVEVVLTVTLTPADSGTDVAWTGELRLGGTAASVGQRVGADIAQRVVDDVLVQLARA
jgi:carbon monoxide dehydrogenase subunit G